MASIEELEKKIAHLEAEHATLKEDHETLYGEFDRLLKKLNDHKHVFSHDEHETGESNTYF